MGGSGEFYGDKTKLLPSPPPALFQARVFLQVVSSTLYFLIHTVSLPVSAKKIVVKIFQHWFPQLKKKKKKELYDGDIAFVPWRNI